MWGRHVEGNYIRVVFGGETAVIEWDVMEEAAIQGKRLLLVIVGIPLIQ